jgi:hypothetical protein
MHKTVNQSPPNLSPQRPSGLLTMWRYGTADSDDGTVPFLQ